jgi:hypothetical protein
MRTLIRMEISGAGNEFYMIILVHPDPCQPDAA